MKMMIWTGKVPGGRTEQDGRSRGRQREAGLMGEPARESNP